MNVALVASSYLPHAGELERHVDQLARGLARRGAQVEVLTHDPARRLPRVSGLDGVVVRRFVAPIGNARFAVAPGLWEHLRRTAGSSDITHVHTAQVPLAFAVARAGRLPLVFTPRAPVQRLLRWPYARLTQAVVDHAAQTLCASTVERDLLRGRFPWGAHRIRVLPDGVDVAAIRAARPFAASGSVVLTGGRLERHKRVDRAIAAMASLDPALRLVVVGEGPVRHRLQAHAADLNVSSRVEFVGSVPDAELYRWLRTARVLLALTEQDASGLQVTEAMSAGTPVVASDIPVHREAASRVDGAGVIFVSPEGSPLEVADAIAEAGGINVRPTVPILSWDAVVDSTLTLYEGLAFAGAHAARTRGGGNGRGAGPDVRVVG
jgi:glycosyltransferase involved in cell wall biosynthesis